MGNHDLGRSIGREAQICFERRQAGERAIDILDRICKGRGGDAEFEAEDPQNPGYQHPDYGNYTDPDPKAGLGMLMVEAFAPNGLKDLPKYDGVLGVPLNATSEQQKAADHSSDLWWAEVYRPFKERYGFW